MAAAAVPVLALAEGGLAEHGVHVHPLVLFNVCDSFVRRQEGSVRVIGTLLGTVTGGGSRIEITNSYAVPHNEGQGSVSLDVDFHKTMLSLHQKVHPNEGVVGWFSTGVGVSPGDVLLHEFFSREVPTAAAAAAAADGATDGAPSTNGSLPVHLTVDTGLTDGRMDVSAYVSTKLEVGGNTAIGTQFTKVDCEVIMEEVERVGPQLLATADASSRVPRNAEGLAASVAKLQGMVGTAVEYVEKVVRGEVPADLALGRKLAEAVRSVPRVAKAEFESAFQDSVQDVLLIEYLAKLTQTHMAFAARLNKFSLPV